MTASIDPGARKAFGLRKREPVGVLVQLDGTPLRVSAAGDVDQVLPPGHARAGAASDPANRRRP